MPIRTEGHWVPCCDLMSVGGICPTHGRYGDQVAKVLKSEADADLELTQAALEACGYRVHLRERAGTRWVTACKGLQVQYTHWHPLTNIHQAMQLLIDAPGYGVSMKVYGNATGLGFVRDINDNMPVRCDDAKDLINAQCRAIVTACASLKAVR